MQCFFCPNPAAHPATGCQYAPGVLACEECVRAFWAWARTRTEARVRKGGKRRPNVPAADFATAAGKQWT